MRQANYGPQYRKERERLIIHMFLHLYGSSDAQLSKD